MFSISGDTATGCPVLGEFSSLFGRVKSFFPSLLAARLTISCRYTWELPTSAFELELLQFPEAKQTLFLVIFIPWIDWRSRFLWRDTLFALALQHQIGRSGFLPSETHHSRLCLVLVSTWHQSQGALGFERKNTRTWSKNTWCWINAEGDSTHLSKNFLLVSMSASWLLVSTNLIWILGSKLILSNN